MASPQEMTYAGNRAAVSTPVGGPWKQVISGETGPGSLYALYVPKVWNGDAVYIAHGFRDAPGTIDLRDQDSLYATRDSLGARGYAVAYSSYSENGLAVKDGTQRTHQLRALLGERLPAPATRHFLLGYSLGGGIALNIAQQHSSEYQGALLVCGMVGGSRLQTQYLGHVRALFDAFYPNKLPGNVLGVPQGTVVTIPQVIAAVSSNPNALAVIASTAQTPLPWVPRLDGTPEPATLIGSLWAALSFHARGINNITDLVNGKSAFENNAPYTPGTSLLPPALLGPALAAANHLVTRYSIAPSAANYLEHHFTPTGELGMPVLTLHNRWDPAVPEFHETALRNAVAAQGNSGSLLQRKVNAYGHCAINADQVQKSFYEVADWARTGVKPAS
ncbi:MAG TPA: alpha/beta hydrolase [Gemmatimonas sp.]|nr:alpha/beta hydrolase [Gemmatimonas sp.]